MLEAELRASAHRHSAAYFPTSTWCARSSSVSSSTAIVARLLGAAGARPERRSPPPTPVQPAGGDPGNVLWSSFQWHDRRSTPPCHPQRSSAALVPFPARRCRPTTGCELPRRRGPVPAAPLDLLRRRGAGGGSERIGAGAAGANRQLSTASDAHHRACSARDPYPLQQLAI